MRIPLPYLGMYYGQMISVMSSTVRNVQIKAKMHFLIRSLKESDLFNISPEIRITH